MVITLFRQVYNTYQSQCGTSGTLRNSSMILMFLLEVLWLLRKKYCSY